MSEVETLGFYRLEHTSTAYKFYIDEIVGPPSMYRELLNVLSTATEDDVVELEVNTKGGDLSSAVAIITAIRGAACTVVGKLHGDAMSAGSAIALSCHQLEVGKFANIMIHNGSYVTGGTHTDIRGYVDFNESYLNNFLDDVYEGFLTQDEIDEVKEGKTFWLLSEEIGARLEARNKYFSTKEVTSDE